MTEEKKTPLKKFRAGQITATIWENDKEGKDGKTFKAYSVNITKSYGVEEDNKTVWKDTNNFQKDDLPKVVLVSNLAYAEIVLAKESAQ